VRERGLEGSFWPSARQKLLLRTAFADGDAGAQAWQCVRAQLDLERLEPGTFPLLPLVHRRLEQLGIADPFMPTLAGIRRRTWYLNWTRLGGAATVLRALEQGGAEPLVVDGWEIPARCYGGDFGLRTIDGLDVLVRRDRIDAARRMLAALGYTGPDDRRADRERFRRDGFVCTLHRRLSREFSDPARGVELDDLRGDTTTFTVGEATAHGLSPADELVRVCLAGARATALPSALWAADALAVLAAEGAELDWDRVLRHARRLRATLRLRDALAYLMRELGAAVPGDVVAALEATPARGRERVAHRLAGRTGRLLGPAPRTATRFLQITAHRSRSEEHTSELQSRENLVCRLLLEKKKH